MATSDHPPLHVISPEATPDEVAAITAALAVIYAEREAAARAAKSAADDALSAWVQASRLTARRAGLVRGPWRLSGRIGRRARA
jgi:Acyl-CoA carboxylase epsilon subunit